jgi:hypothetical protein
LSLTGVEAKGGWGDFEAEFANARAKWRSLMGDGGKIFGLSYEVEK